MDASMLWPGVVALVVAIAVAGAGRLVRRPGLAALAAAAGLLAGWWWTMGLVTASPRQLPERLPLLAACLLLLAAIGTAAARPGRGIGRWIGPAIAGAGALATGWWMAGAPRTGADLATALPVLAGVTALALLLLRRDAAWSAPAAALVLLAGLVLARLPGPGVVLGVAAAAAALGGALGAAPSGRASPAAALPLAGGLAALAVLPLLARGAAADWAVVAAPVLLLWAGPALGGALPVGIPRAALAIPAALACLGGVWLLR